MENLQLTFLTEEELSLIDGGHMSAWWIVAGFCVSPAMGCLIMGINNGINNTI